MDELRNILRVILKMKLVIGCLLVFALCFQAGTLAIDSHLLVIQWPKSLCNSGARKMCTSVPNHFIIHGLWPQMANGAPVPAPPGKLHAAIQHCSGTCVSVLVQNDPALYQAMQQIWPGITVTLPNAMFWKHEWDRHGAFSGFTQHDYFKIAVDRANDLGVQQLVQAAGINVGQKYTFQDFKNVIQAAVGLKLGRPLEVVVKCNRDLSTGSNKVVQIYEIRFCTDKTGLQFINCSSKTSSISPCGPMGTYALPPP